MIQLIKQIFIDSGFEPDYQITTKPYEQYKSLFAKRIKKNKFDFFLILSVREENLDVKELEKVMNELFEKILQTQEYPGIDKNLSLLLIVEREIITYTDEFTKKVYDFEENPFQYKKYILPFTIEQKQLIEKNLNTQLELVKQLDEIISKKDWFSLFKDQQIKESEQAIIYDLVSKIYIKLPFLKMKVNKEELPNITEAIEDEIAIEDKEIVIKVLGMDHTNLNWEEILKLLEVELDEF